MAKKKKNRQGQGQGQAKPNQIPIQPSEQNDQKQPKLAMDDPEEKFQSLKTLNARLVKETHESRKEVESLIKSKEALEVDLEKSGNEKEKLLSEFTEANEEILGLELERNVVRTFVRTRIDETGVEFRGLIKEKADREAEIGLLKEVIKRVENEREEMKAAFDDLVVEATELKGKLVEMVKNERMVLEEVENLKVQCKELMGEKAENEIEKEVLLNEKETVKRMFDEAIEEMEKLMKKWGLKWKRMGLN